MTIPKLSDIYSDIISDFETKFGTTLPVVGKSFLRIWASVMSGVIFTCYLALAKVQKNIFVDTCDFETLQRFGRVKLGRNPFPAIAGEYLVTISGVPSTLIPSGTVFVSDDTSLNPKKYFILNSDTYTSSISGVANLPLTAQESGSGSKLSIGNTLTLTAPIALIDDIGTVVFEATEPSDAETESDYRRKIIDSFRLEPQGGAGADYRLWADDVPQVRQTYPFANSGTTEVNLWIEANLADGVDGVPSAGTIEAVRVAVEDPTADRPSRKPITDNVNFLPVVVRVVTIDIVGFVDGTPEIEASISAAIFDYLRNVRPFVSSIDILADKNDFFGRNKIISLILESNPGSIFGEVKMYIDGVELVSFQFLGGNIPKLGVINYV